MFISTMFPMRRTRAIKRQRDFPALQLTVVNDYLMLLNISDDHLSERKASRQQNTPFNLNLNKVKYDHYQ